MSSTASARIKSNVENLPWPGVHFIQRPHLLGRAVHCSNGMLTERAVYIGLLLFQRPFLAKQEKVRYSNPYHTTYDYTSGRLTGYR